MTLALWASILAGALALAAPLIIAGVGEGFVERAGRLNLGIEGMMILGALTGVFVAHVAGPVAGLVAAGVVGLLLAALMNVLVYALKANEIVVGLAITMLGLGLSTFLSQVWIPAGTTNVSVDTISSLDLGALTDIPLVGPMLFGQSPVVYGTIVLLAVAWAVMRFTRFGLQVRATGADAASAALRGVRPRRVGENALLIGGALAGIAGGTIALAVIGSFTPGMTAGRGYIVLAIVIMGRMTPLGIALGGLLFGFLQNFSLLSQSTSIELPSEVFTTLPYLVTLIVLVVTSRAELRRQAARLRLT
ncbi:MAG: ABC transporter permease [Microbacterium sp.]|uniref:ABC transporter permease n=1 Tax=Microbacterium sp. TaxID=51671 RepID=UPI002604FDD6|nr:ABC transporter permease [Microbacterium sp.]MCX6502852.1 ABC transporter permease [Microbacterium sp.]